MAPFPTAQPADCLFQLVRHAVVVECKFCDMDVGAGTMQLALASIRYREGLAKSPNSLLEAEDVFLQGV